MKLVLKIMPQNLSLSFFVLMALFFSTNCGEGEDILIDDSATIFIVGYAFSPTTISAPAGSSVFFYNQDDVPHHILSESTNDAFDDSGLLDSQPILPGEIASVIIPSASASGAEIHFYDDLLQDEMVTPNGIIVVE